MKTVKDVFEYSIKKEKSEFISFLFHVDNQFQVERFLKQIKSLHCKAKHIVYAYRINDLYKYSDDGEPAGTAGKPLFDLLQKKEMNEVLLIVVRYFGGVLLGASRLLSTYIESGVLVINNADLYTIQKRFIYNISVSYSTFESIKRFSSINSYIIENIEYGEDVTFDLLSESDDVDNLISNYNNLKIEFHGNKNIYVKE